ncbi:MAG: type II toxin-antitoxin system PemK/MazF family toxin [Euryarchaeota archaeon]|nr:type II toxin-antitoxin system PemK/MazF family toxin [Euryarchaeota archaeon]MDE1836932.1 type II toxin-antitoxin system PemK/MazF family toxin [Euryarchaeota archaeon]MDE1882226.1 type II toxin-antitoxin system PemK/MazF family toxin [Euryarchaeota archaeon]MDE2045082.1 type II toxin-antitoxin system PemK/MazF family toxin [Thermoplasmata archaeon]
MTPRLERGGVSLVEFPNIDFRSWKPRPALLVQDPSVRGPYPDVLVAAITSAIETTGPTRPLFHVESPEGRSMGLRTDSVLALDNLATVPEDRILRQLGTCPVMGMVDDLLRALLGLP